MFLEDWDDVVDIDLDWGREGGEADVNFGLEIDLQVLVAAVALYEFKDFFQGLDLGTGVNCITSVKRLPRHKE